MESPSQASMESLSIVERSGMEHVEEPSAVEDEVEVKSVYVKNVPTTMNPSEIEEEFKKFGRLKPDGVAIRTQKAYTMQIAGHHLYIEGRRLIRGIPIRGRGRGRGRISYQMGGTRGRFGGRGSGRGNSQDGSDWDYIRPRANCFYRHGTQQERVFSSSQQGLRNGQDS